jgi:hypothetical protein
MFAVSTSGNNSVQNPLLERTGHMELDGDTVPLQPISFILTKRCCRERAVGQLKVVVAMPAFNTTDEWFDN